LFGVIGPKKKCSLCRFSAFFLRSDICIHGIGAFVLYGGCPMGVTSLKMPDGPRSNISVMTISVAATGSSAINK